MLTIPAGRRAAVVAGVRTPFAKSGTALKDVTAVTLARHATKELLYRTDLPGSEVDEVIFGQVIPSVLVPNIAREVSLLPQFPKTIPAYSLNRACASGAQAIVNAADQIMLGRADVVVAGGAESLSDIPILHSRRMSTLLVEASKARSLGQRLGVLSQDPARGTSCRSRPPSRSRRRASRWGSRPRRWPRRTASAGKTRTGWRW